MKYKNNKSSEGGEEGFVWTQEVEESLIEHSLFSASMFVMKTAPAFGSRYKTLFGDQVMWSEPGLRCVHVILSLFLSEFSMQVARNRDMTLHKHKSNHNWDTQVHVNTQNLGSSQSRLSLPAAMGLLQRQDVTQRAVTKILMNEK